jgi:hypothetical protein
LISVMKMNAVLVVIFAVATVVRRRRAEGLAEGRGEYCDAAFDEAPARSPAWPNAVVSFSGVLPPRLSPGR